MKLPNFPYEFLPFLYVIVGSLAAINTDGIGRASGVLLITAGLVVFKLRLSYRSRWDRDFRK